MQFLKAKINKPVSFISCGHFISDEGWIHNKRMIDNFEVIIGLKGIAYIQQDLDRYEIGPGTVLLLQPGRVHQGYKLSENNTSFYWVHFHTKELYHILEQKEAFSEIYPLKLSPYTNLLNESIILPTFSLLENNEKINILFRQLLHTSRSKNYTSFTEDYLVTLLLIGISQQVIQNTFKTTDPVQYNNRRFFDILEWIRINFQKDISVAEIAERFNFNKDYLCRLFKKHLGVSVVRYINTMKISTAKVLLCQSDQSIKEIAYSVGFKDDKYFLKLFKEYENITPSEFRNAYYQTHLNNL